MRRLSLYQRWAPGGKEQYRALPAHRQIDEMWYLLHEPGSLQVSELIKREREGTLPDPPPFAKTRPSRQEPLTEAVTAAISIRQKVWLQVESERRAVSAGTIVRELIDKARGKTP